MDKDLIYHKDCVYEKLLRKHDVYSLLDSLDYFKSKEQEKYEKNTLDFYLEYLNKTFFKDIRYYWRHPKRLFVR